MSEFKFQLSGNPVSTAGVTVTNPGGSNPTGEVPANLIDGSLTTKMLDFNKVDPIVFDFGVTTALDGYNFATGGDAPERDPVSWTFQGSNDNTNWTVLDTRTNFTADPGRGAFEAAPFLLGPTITSFVSDLTVVKNGQTANLTWVVDSPSAGDTFSIDQGVGTVTAANTKTITPPSSATTTYTLTATNSTNGATSTATVPVRAVVGGAVSYRYIRFTPVNLRNDAAANSVQMDEFTIYSGGSFLPYPTGTTATNPGGANAPDAAEGALKAIDGLLTTKWLDFNRKPLVIDMTTPTSFDSYTYTTGGDAPERDPVRWTLEGSNDGTTWIVIDNMTAFNFPAPTARNAETQVIPLPGASLPAQIVNFMTDAPNLVPGQPAVLKWQVQGATSISIDNGIGAVSGTGSVTVSPTVATTYTLTVVKTGFPNQTATVTITPISPAPTVTTINYPSNVGFTNAGSEIVLVKSASILTDTTRTLPGAYNRLRLNPDSGSVTGAAWFAKRIDFSQGFDTTFDMSFITLNAASIGADGLSFMIQNYSNSLVPPPTEDKGFQTNCLTINFDSYLNAPEPSAATVQIWENGTMVKLIDLPTAFPAALGTGVSDLTQKTAGAAPYPVHITLNAGKLNVFFNNVQILTDFAVDLTAIGAVDAAGTGYAGFVGRAGGQYEAHDITDWILTPNAAAANPLAITASSINATTGSGSLTWSSTAGKTYRITTSPDLVTWTSLATAIPATAGSTTKTFSFTQGTKGFFRVEQE